jgi:hypothetical protein
MEFRKHRTKRLKDARPQGQRDPFARLGPMWERTRSYLLPARAAAGERQSFRSMMTYGRARAHSQAFDHDIDEHARPAMDGQRLCDRIST